MSQGYEMQKHRADLLKGELDRALTRVAELLELNRQLGEGVNERTGELDAERRRVAELESWRTAVLDEAYRQEVAGHPEQCVYCGARLCKAHMQWCPIGNAPNERKEGGS